MPDCSLVEPDLNSVLWMQTSAEYQALTEEIYRWGKKMLVEAAKDPGWSAATEQETTAGKSPAVILDIDETVLDNSAYQARLLKHHENHNDDRFQLFRDEAVSRAINGAVDFCRFAQGQGVTVFYITNQRASMEKVVRDNLNKLGFPIDDQVDTVLVQGEREDWNSSDKTSRRRFVSDKYRVILLFGDDLNDFVPANGKTLQERSALLERYRDYFGKKWFMIPNPTYGSWERSVLGKPGLPKCEQIRIKNEALRTDEKQ